MAALLFHEVIVEITGGERERERGVTEEGRGREIDLSERT